MAKKKNINLTKEHTVQKKIDEIKLASHVHAVKTGHHVDINQQLKYHASELRNAIDRTVA
jgi:hypothetical protein